MIKANLLCVLLGVSILMSGCASTEYRNAAAQIQTANPHAALEYITLSLQQKPDDPKTRLMLDGLIKTISRDHEMRIELMRREKTYEEAVAECDRVIASAHLVSSIPPGNDVLYYEERERAELAELAADKNYRLALDYESQKRSREAVDAYCRALGFRAAYKDAEKRRIDILDSATSKLFMTADISKEPELAKHLLSALGPATLAARPRFLKIVRDETNATSKCIVSIESVTIDDSGWVGKSLDRDMEASRWVDSNGTVHTRRAMHVRGTLYSRKIVCTMSANFFVNPIRETDPQPTGTTMTQAEDANTYAQWQGDPELLPSGVASLPQQPPILKDPSALKTECVRSVVSKLGDQLFLAYK